jgi:type VI secretion system protein ImpK
MTPEFAKHVDAVFSQVLRLLERIARGENPSPQDEHARIRAAIDGAEAAIGKSAEWRLAKYALVAWIDEMLVNATVGSSPGGLPIESPSGSQTGNGSLPAVAWKGSDWWNNNVLEREFFHKRERSKDYYLHANEAHQQSARNALEVFYLGVVLGFVGFYARKPEDVRAIAAENEFPDSIQKWAERTSAAIRKSPRPTLTAGAPLGPGAPPLSGQALLVSSSMLLAALLVLAAGGLLYTFN